MQGMFYDCKHILDIIPGICAAKIKSYLRNLPKQDHALLLNSLWGRVKPLLKDTTKLNNHFKRYAVKTEPVKETINAPKSNILTIDLPSDWQDVDIPQWNP
jgi:hypothetical protein